MYKDALTKGGLALLLVFATGVYVIKSINRFAEIIGKKCPSFVLGWFGEKRIGNILSKLPDMYHVFYDVKLHERKGNIDYVVIGPPGIFTIEVKYYRRGWATQRQHDKNKRHGINCRKHRLWY